jgi:Fungal protein kinase
LRRKAGILQADISLGNLMMNENKDGPCWKAFLIDLDLAFMEERTAESVAPNKIGTKVFMSIGALYGKRHSFMDDLESFFWVLFWICIHYHGPNNTARVVPLFEKWNYMSIMNLAMMKSGTISSERDFLSLAKEYFTPYFQPLIRCVNNLRKVVFPNNHRWEREDERLYDKMRQVLRKAVEDLEG